MFSLHLFSFCFVSRLDMRRAGGGGVGTSSVDANKHVRKGMNSEKGEGASTRVQNV